MAGDRWVEIEAKQNLHLVFVRGPMLEEHATMDSRVMPSSSKTTHVAFSRAFVSPAAPAHTEYQIQLLEYGPLPVSFEP